MVEISRAGGTSAHNHTRGQEERVREALPARVMDLVEREPGVEAALLENLIPGGNGAARLLVLQGKLHRRGNAYYPTREGPLRELGEIRVNVELANKAMVGPGALGTRGVLRAKLVQDFLDRHPGARHEDLEAHFAGGEVRTSQLRRALSLLLQVRGIERTRRPKDGAHRYWPFGQAPDDEDPAPLLERIPDDEEPEPEPERPAAPAPPQTPAAAATETHKEETPPMSTSTARLAPASSNNGQHRNKDARADVLEYIQKRPGGVDVAPRTTPFCLSCGCWELEACTDVILVNGEVAGQPCSWRGGFGALCSSCAPAIAIVDGIDVDELVLEVLESKAWPMEEDDLFRVLEERGFERDVAQEALHRLADQDLLATPHGTKLLALPSRVDEPLESCQHRDVELVASTICAHGPGVIVKCLNRACGEEAMLHWRDRAVHATVEVAP